MGPKKNHRRSMSFGCHKKLTDFFHALESGTAASFRTSSRHKVRSFVALVLLGGIGGCISVALAIFWLLCETLTFCFHSLFHIEVESSTVRMGSDVSQVELCVT